MASPHVIDVTEANFETEVMEYSDQSLVLVDFWAEWCGPCKELGPRLEALADEYRGAFRVAKVDTDKEQRLGTAFQIQSLPTVMAIFHGESVNRFSGALPTSELKRFIDQLLAQTGAQVPPSDEAPTDPVQAEAWWREKLTQSADDAAALLALGKILIAKGQSDEAIEMLNTIDTSTPEYGDAKAALATLDLLTQVAEAGGEAAIRARLATDPTDQTALYLCACADAGNGRFIEALDTFVTLVATAGRDVRDDAKKAAAIVFETAGRDDPNVEQLRRKLTRLLF